MICVDANVLIAALDATDAFHEAASAELVTSDEAIALNVTIAEALVHPIRVGRGSEARDLLAAYGVEPHPVDDAIAFAAATLRAEHGNRNFPLLDALVVAAGREIGARIVTGDARWPAIPGVEITVLQPNDP